MQNLLDSMKPDRRKFLKGLTTIGMATQPSVMAAKVPRVSDFLTFDLVIVGGTTAGVGAAIAAYRHSIRVAVIEETPTLGGLLANGPM